MIHSQPSTPESTAPVIRLILPLSLFILSQIVTIHDQLTPLLLAHIINSASYFDLMKFLVLDIILAISPSSEFLISPTNNTYHLIVLLEPETKLNNHPLCPIESFFQCLMMITMMLTRHQFITVWRNMCTFYHRLAISTFPSAC